MIKKRMVLVAVSVGAMNGRTFYGIKFLGKPRDDPATPCGGMGGGNTLAAMALGHCPSTLIASTGRTPEARERLQLPT